MHPHVPWLDIDLAALRRNAARYRELVGAPLLPMIKADGYGLGAIPVARALEAVDPWGYGVASIEEAAPLRAVGIKRPLLAILPFRPSLRDRYLELGVRPAIGDQDSLMVWLPTERPFHLAVDTGMGRTGFRWHDTDVLLMVRDLMAGRGGYEGVFTHFSSADEDDEVTAEQWQRFEAALACLGRPPLVHAAASSAGRFGTRYGGSLARPGIFLFGGPVGDLVPEPVAALRAPVVAVRRIRAGDAVSYGGTWRATEDGEVATLAIGYADGVLRTLGNRGLVGLAGKVFPIAGRVTMDMVMVVTPPGTVRPGDAATLWGGVIPIAEQAERAGTISYELLTAVGRRVVRRYHGGNS